jgi:hypothetical protein
MKKILFAAVVLSCALSCTNVDKTLADDFIATNQKYDVYEAEFDLSEIYSLPIDSLTAYSSRRINIGSIRDDTYGLFKRGCAVTLVPVLDSIDFGTDPVFERMRFQASLDSVSVEDKSQLNILQYVNVYPLTKALDSTNYASRSQIEYSKTRISKDIPVLNGSDSLIFYFTEDYGKQYLNMTNDDLQDFDEYQQKFPGIYLTTNDPAGVGGRFNMFNFNILEYSNSYLVRTDNYAVLYFNAEFDGERKDSLLMFYFSPIDFQDLDSLIDVNVQPSQYVLNLDSHETDALGGIADDKIYVEGGSGLKPVILASEIKSLVTNDIIKNGGDPNTTIITKATIVLPFDFPDDYTTMFRFPDELSPTVRISRNGSVTFAGLTDASVSTENQGTINRSLCEYAPDITHHVQEIIRTTDSTNLANYNIWMLNMSQESSTSTNSEAQELSDYYTQMAYYSYYNDMYGGYGYGSYGSYGSYYNNYYNYMLLAAYASQSASSTSYSYELDKDRYYRAILRGPNSTTGPTPKLKVSYVIPKQ